jgi:hypothetical protein
MIARPPPIAARIDFPIRGCALDIAVDADNRGFAIRDRTTRQLCERLFRERVAEFRAYRDQDAEILSRLARVRICDDRAGRDARRRRDRRQAAFLIDHIADDGQPAKLHPTLLHATPK